MKNRTIHYNKERFKVLVVAAGMIFALAGCGQGDSIETSAEIQNEGVAEDGMSGTESAVTDGTEQVTSEDETVESSETNITSAQMEIDEETRNELTAQLLEENDLDTSVIESGRSTRGCTFDLPEGFEESEDMSGMYVTGRYPLDASTIYYAAMDQDIAMQLLTEEAFKEQLQENLHEAYGDDIEVTIDSFESIRVSGYPAFRIRCRYQVNRIEITQLEYAINADKSYMVTYSQTGDYDRMEEYEASAATIRVQ